MQSPHTPSHGWLHPTLRLEVATSGVKKSPASRLSPFLTVLEVRVAQSSGGEGRVCGPFGTEGAYRLGVAPLDGATETELGGMEREASHDGSP